MRRFDLVVVGGGSGGYAAARTAAGLGLKVAVVEGGEEVGGLCILRGCMPTKALLQASDVLHLAGKAKVWGLRVEDVSYDFGAVMARKDRLIREFAEYRRGQLGSGRFEFIRALARFVSPHRLELDNGEAIEADHFVIATGSVVSPPPLPDLAQAGYWTSDDALRLTSLPRSLAVLGGGAVAVEFAQFFSRFGVEVTLIQRSPRLLRDFDADAAAVVEGVLRREGMTVHTGTKLVGAARAGGKKQVVFEQAGSTQRLTVDEILFALGRTPNTASLGLEAAGVQRAGTRILTDDQQRTSVPHIYAVGDCAGPHEIVHIAIQQGEIAAHNAARPATPKRMDYRLLTSVVFTEPQIGVVGLTEETAKTAGIPYKAASYPFNDHGKSLIMDAMDGFVKLLAAPGTGEILGGCCVGPMGGELIHEIVAAMHGRLTVGQLASMPHYHPTLAEIWTYPAEELAEATAT